MLTLTPKTPVYTLTLLTLKYLQDNELLEYPRYYWQDKTVRLMMIHTNLEYGFEYLGNTNRLVITPLTDR